MKKERLKGRSREEGAPPRDLARKKEKKTAEVRQNA